MKVIKTKDNTKEILKALQQRVNLTKEAYQRAVNDLAMVQNTIVSEAGHSGTRFVMTDTFDFEEETRELINELK